MRLLLVRLKAIASRFNIMISLCEQRRIKKLIIVILSLSLAMFIIISGTKDLLAAKHKTDWFNNAKWGVITHYLTTPEMSAKAWNERVNSFDVKGLAKQLKAVGAKYYMITIGQNSGHYISPNHKYDYYTGIVPSKCSTRDLVSDLYEELNPLGIKLMVYLPAIPPLLDRVAMSKLGWINGPNRNKNFQVKWESIIREWSLRWGVKVNGWWFDAVYWPKEVYDHKQTPNFQSFALAVKAGNSNSIVAFNPSPKYPLTRVSKYEDYTAGEAYDVRGLECESRWVETSQFHLMSFLGTDWGVGPTRYNNKQVMNIIHNVNKCGGVITWDVPIQINGLMPQSFTNQLIQVKNGLKNKNFILANRIILRGNVAGYKKARLLDIAGKQDLPVVLTKHFAGQGVDGDLKTFAQAGDSWAWIYQVDLAKIYSIGRILITFGPTFSTEYQVMSSDDGAKWSILKHEKNAKGGKYNYKFKATNMRYIRVKSIQPDAPNQPGIQMSIAELEAYQK